MFFTNCKKLEPNEPITKDGLKIFNFVTDDEMPYSPIENWVRKPDGEIWTWAKTGMYKVFDENQNVSGFTIPYASISPGKNTFPKNYDSQSYSDFHTHNIYSVNTSGNLEHAYLDTINDESGIHPTKLYLCKNEIDKSGNIINQDSVYIHDYFRVTSPFGDVASINLTLNSFKLTKTNNAYYFAFELNYSSSNTFGYIYTDTLYLLKTDLNLNIQSLYKKSRDYNSNNDYTNPEVFDIEATDNLVCLTYKTVRSANYYSGTATLFFDSGLNLIKTQRADELITMASGDNEKAFKKILIQNNRVYLFGDVEPDYFGNSNEKKIYVSIFDLNGNFIQSKKIITKRSYSIFRGVEPTSDGKLLVYYTESDGSAFDKLGISKIDRDGNAEFSFMFPETDDSSYDVLFSYEGNDGNIYVYGSRYFNNFIGEQTFYVKLNREGKIQ
jgi:hypothetical protein